MELFHERISKNQWLTGLVAALVYYFRLAPYLFVMPVVMVVAIFIPMEPEQKNHLGYFLIMILYVAFILFFFRFFREAASAFKREWRRNLVWVLLGTVGIIVLSNMLMMTLAGMFHPIEESANQAKLSQMLSAYPVTMSILIVMIGPIIEELVYRVIVFRGIRRTSRMLAYAVSALLFGFQHVYEAVLIQHQTAELWNMLTPTVSGILLCWLYERRRTIWVPIGAHVVSNLLGVIMMGLS